MSKVISNGYAFTHNAWLTVIIPNVNHRNLGVRHPKQALREPCRVPLQIERLKFISHFWGERRFVFVFWVPELGPVAEKVRLLHYCIIINLISST